MCASLDVWSNEIHRFFEIILGNPITISNKIPKITNYINNLALGIITLTLVALLIQKSSDKKEDEKKSLIMQTKIWKVTLEVKSSAHIPY